MEEQEVILPAPIPPSASIFALMISLAPSPLRPDMCYGVTSSPLMLSLNEPVSVPWCSTTT